MLHMVNVLVEYLFTFILQGFKKYFGINKCSFGSVLGLNIFTGYWSILQALNVLQKVTLCSNINNICNKARLEENANKLVRGKKTFQKLEHRIILNA